MNLHSFSGSIKDFSRWELESMIVDAHQHFFSREQYAKIFSSYGSPDVLRQLLRDFSPSDLKPILDEVGVDKTVLIQIENTIDHTYDLLDLADFHDWIAAVVGWVDLMNPQVGDVLEKLVSHPKFKGVRHPLEFETDPAWVLKDDVLYGLRKLADKCLAFDLLVGEPHWPIIPKLAQKIPDLSMVIEHFGKPTVKSVQVNEWITMVGMVAAFPQIYIKISGIKVFIPKENWENWDHADIKPYIEIVIETFGVDRVIFATDWPVCTLIGSYERIFDAIQKCLVDLNLSVIDKSKILGENAKHFYKIS